MLYLNSKKLMLTIFHIISKCLKLSESYRYQLLFVFSIALHHSTQFYEMKENQHQNIFLLGLLDKINPFWVELVLTLITLVVVFLIIIKTFINSQENYRVEIIERIVYPVQLYVLKGVVYQNTKNGSNLQLMVRVLFFITTMFNTVILIIKNSKLCLRYASHREKGLNKLASHQYFLTIIKILLSIVLNVILPQNFLVYFILSCMINFLINLAFTLNITYEHPNIQYISLLTQFYLWLPLISQIFTYFYSNNYLFLIFNFTTFLLYAILSLIKPKVFIPFLEKKYTNATKQINSYITTSNSQKTQKNSNNFIAITSLVLSLVVQTEKGQKKLQWSKPFKCKIFLFIKSKILGGTHQNKIRYFQDHNQNNINQTPQIKLHQSKQNSQKSIKLSQTSKNSQKTSQTFVSKEQKIDLLEQFRIRLKNKADKHNPDNYQNFGNICQILWSFVYPYLSSKDKEFKNLRLFMCYAFPDLRNNMKFRLFHSYYSNSFNQFGIFCQIQARICYKYLISLVGSQIQEQKLRKENEDLIEKQMGCLQKEISYQNLKFNDVIKQKQIRTKIIKDFENFFENEQLYLKIFININQNKENIRKYFNCRREIRLKTQQNLKDYSQLKNKKNHFVLIANYMKDYFLQKNFHSAGEKFEKHLSKLILPQKLQIRKNIESTQNKTSFGQRIVESIKQNLFTDKESQNIVCVVSGLKNLDLIKISSPRFKEIMEIDSGQFSIENQSAIINYLSHFQLPLWRQKHIEEMKKIQFYEKPVHHEKKKYFLISHKGSNLIEVKFKMYFFVMYETDFLLVLDIKYEKCELLEIKDCHQKIVYSYKQGKDNLNIEPYSHKKNEFLIEQISNNFKLLNQRYQQQQLELYGSYYQLKTIKKQKLCTPIIDRQFIANKKITRRRYLTQKAQQQNFIFQEKKMSQEKFILFKKNFNIHQKLWNSIKTFVLGSVLFFFITFYFLSIQQNSNKQSTLGLIKDKLLIQNKIVSLDAYSCVQIGILYEIVKGRIWFDKPQQKQEFFNQVFDSLLLLKRQLDEKSQLSRIDNKNKGQLDQYLYQSDWIPGNNISLLTHTLKKQDMFYQSLSIFLDPLILDKKQNSSQYGVSSLTQLPTIISLNQQNQISKNLHATVVTKDYFFDTNGVLDQMQILQKQLFSSHSQVRTLFLVVFCSGFTIFSIFAIFLIVKLKKQILSYYNLAILVSEPFKQKFQSQTTKLLSYIQQLKKCSQNDLSGKIKPQRISYQQESRKLTYIRRHTGQEMKTSIWNKKERYQNNDAKLSVPKYLLQSVLFPFLRYFVVLGSVFFITQIQTENMKILQEYSKSLRVLNRLNVNFVVGFAINLYSKKFESDSFSAETLREQFYKSAKQIREIDKIKTIYDLFPFNPQIANSVLFQPNVELLGKLSISKESFVSISSKSFLEETNHLLLLYKSLFNEFYNKKWNQEHGRFHIIESYQKLNDLFWLIERITQKSFQFLQQKVRFYYTFWFIGLMVFLAIEFKMGTQHFNQTLTQFNEEYLNLASYEELKKQDGFNKFVNLSTTNYFTIIDQDRSYMNHV